jgi:hypothetical protein
VPKRKVVPDLNEKPKVPAKWTAFAPRDSKALEIAFQKIIANPGEPARPVPVNEDHLFEVDIPARELNPVYFRGSTYEVPSYSSGKVLMTIGTSRRMVFPRRIRIETL